VRKRESVDHKFSKQLVLTRIAKQGGIHPDFDGSTYLEILAAAKAGAPGIHVHAFSPLEVHQGAATLGWPLPRCRRPASPASVARDGLSVCPT